MTCEIMNAIATPEGIQSDDRSKTTLVLEAGMGNWSIFLSPLAHQLKKFAKVCLISRDGYLDSVQSSTTRDGFFFAHQLKSVLDANMISEPVILLGHSLGGLHMRMFQHLFPQRVRGLILLDSAHPRMLEVLTGIKSNLEKQIRLVTLLRLLARLGLLRLAKGGIPTFGLPLNLHGPYYKVTTRAGYYTTYLEEMKRFESTLTLCKELNSLGELPLLIISSPYGLNKNIAEKLNAEKSEDQAWISLQKDLTGLSSQSFFVKSKGDHFLHLTDTDFVAQTIKDFCSKY